MRYKRSLRLIIVVWAGLAGMMDCFDICAAEKAPAWMQALRMLQVPVHDDKADAVTMYAHKILVVAADGKMTSRQRVAYKILRTNSKRALVSIPFDEQTKILDIHGWTMPVQGKDYAVEKRSMLTTSASQGFELVTGNKRMFFALPEAEPGALVGYEYEQEERPYFQEDSWSFQDTIPVREATYTLQLPEGWSYKAVWRNHEVQEPTNVGNNRWQWTVSDIKAIKAEENMPPINTLTQRLLIQLVPASGQGKVLESWRDLGNWYIKLVNGRREATPAIKQKVAELTTSQSTLLGKLQALARFSQNDIRYVAIELGIGGLQPHFAADIFSNRYGDCKDKVTLLSTMLKEIGIDSYYVIINASHDVVGSNALPSTNPFNHAILAIQLPTTVKDASLLAVSKFPVLGDILFFDPTNEFIPFGQLPGYLQGNHAMLVRIDGTELVSMPVQQSNTNGVVRTARLALNDKEVLSGEVTERATGQVAFENRSMLQLLSLDSERSRFMESKLTAAFSAFKMLQFKINNEAETAQPIEYKYSFEAEKYAKSNGDLLMIRPRILGSKSSNILETDEKRENAVQFVSLRKDTDEFVIDLPSGYEVDDLPAAVDMDYSFASYHSKSEMTGRALRYVRIFEIKEFTVPVDKLEELKKFYRRIAGDERAIAVFKKSAR